MADWRTYAKAARNTARKQAPGARDAARRATDRAGDYVRAAGRAVDEGWREDERTPRDEHDDRAHRDGSDDRAPRDAQDDRAPREEPGDRRREGEPRPATRQRPSGEQLRRDAAAYYAVASRRAERANIVPRVMRALRDALLIGVSLLVIWGVLAAAGIPIPFTTVLIAVGLIVVVSFGTGLYGQWRRSRGAPDEAEDPRDS